MSAIPAFVVGGSGYVAGELLRLLAGHPRLTVAAVASEGRAGTEIAEAFPHLAGRFRGERFVPLPELAARLERGGRAALFSAAPHGTSAAVVDRLLARAEEVGCALSVVDLSSDFRFADATTWEAVYGRPHGAPHRLAEFACALPEHRASESPRHVGHPGCFTTAVALAAVPLVALGLVEPGLAVSAVTGSTGAGRTPTPTTHHPERRSNLFAYQALSHRHEPEMRRLLREAAGVEPEITFVPHSGPFARGIHATLHARLVEPRPAAEVAERVAIFYAGSPFVEVTAEPPRVQDVAGSNRCRLAFAARGTNLVAFAVLDNLVKGAAGGAVQWMNRLLGLPETAGLEAAGLGWI
jgi:N-acetyl-gamma-glutamyl-phosphate reductase